MKTRNVTEPDSSFPAPPPKQFNTKQAGIMGEGYLESFTKFGIICAFIAVASKNNNKLGD